MSRYKVGDEIPVKAIVTGVSGDGNNEWDCYEVDIPDVDLGDDGDIPRMNQRMADEIGLTRDAELLAIGLKLKAAEAKLARYEDALEEIANCQNMGDPVLGWNSPYWRFKEIARKALEEEDER